MASKYPTLKIDRNLFPSPVDTPIREVQFAKIDGVDMPSPIGGLSRIAYNEISRECRIETVMAKKKPYPPEDAVAMLSTDSTYLLTSSITYEDLATPPELIVTAEIAKIVNTKSIALDKKTTLECRMPVLNQLSYFALDTPAVILISCRSSGGQLFEELALVVAPITPTILKPTITEGRLRKGLSARAQFINTAVLMDLDVSAGMAMVVGMYRHVPLTRPGLIAYSPDNETFLSLIEGSDKNKYDFYSRPCLPATSLDELVVNDLAALYHIGAVLAGPPTIPTVRAAYPIAAGQHKLHEVYNNDRLPIRTWSQGRYTWGPIMPGGIMTVLDTHNGNSLHLFNEAALALFNERGKDMSQAVIDKIKDLLASQAELMTNSAKLNQVIRRVY